MYSPYDVTMYKLRFSITMWRYEVTMYSPYDVTMYFCGFRWIPVNQWNLWSSGLRWGSDIAIHGFESIDGIIYFYFLTGRQRVRIIIRVMRFLNTGYSPRGLYAWWWWAPIYARTYVHTSILTSSHQIYTFKHISFYELVVFVVVIGVLLPHSFWSNLLLSFWYWWTAASFHSVDFCLRCCHRCTAA
jgi:hypothetical protein